MATNVFEGSAFFDEHAEPVEAAIPLLSSDNNNASPSIPVNLK